MIQPLGAVQAGILFTLCAVLGGCNGTSDPSSVSLEQSVPGSSAELQALATPQGARATAPAAAVASLPEQAGIVASVRARAYANGFRQDIILKGSAVKGVDNGITLLARTSQQTTLDEATPLYKPTEAAIRSEIGRTFPHMSMQVVDRPSSNAYGSYGLALGRASGTIHCIYAWQWIEQNDLGTDAGLTGPVAVRIRLCKPDTTFDALADLVNRLSIRSEGTLGAVAVAVIDPPAKSEAKPSHKRAPSGHAKLAPRSSGRRQIAEAPATVSAPPVASRPLAMDLPPQAYLGPKSQSSSIRQN